MRRQGTLGSARLLIATLATTALVAAGLAGPARATTPGADGAIVFAADTGSGYQLFTVDTNGHLQRQITHVAGDAINPDWSPDGSLIVFEHDVANGQAGCNGHVVLVRADGSGPVDLSGGGRTCETQPAFTADGRHIVFERYQPPPVDVDAIWRMDLSGGHRHLVTRGPGAGVTDPNVSPDGTRISFIGLKGGDLAQALFTVHANGSHLTRLTSFTRDVAIKHDWSPDGRRIVFTDHADDPTQAANVATIRPDGTGLRHLTHSTYSALRAYAGSYSPDGRWVVYRLEDAGVYSLVSVPSHGGAGHAMISPSSLRPRYIDWGSASHC